ncbi:MAG: hypothetical protein KJO07_11170 [Deltaproteobacteria bacterium]|nr:hypothetical protein [Deltaproteobacteria bacterium]
MSSAHIIFIPAVLVVGVVIGFVMGSRSARDAFHMEQKRDQERKKARDERAKRKAARAEASE